MGFYLMDGKISEKINNIIIYANANIIEPVDLEDAASFTDQFTEHNLVSFPPFTTVGFMIVNNKGKLQRKLCISEGTHYPHQWFCAEMLKSFGFSKSPTELLTSMIEDPSDVKVAIFTEEIEEH